MIKKIILAAAIVSVAAISPGSARAALTAQQQSLLIGGTDLFVGSSGDRVRFLQQFLSDQTSAADQIYPEKIVSGYFGSLTKSAVMRFQSKNQIVPAAGYMGPKTKAVIGSLLQAQGVSGGASINNTSAIAGSNTSATSSASFVFPIIPATDMQIASSRSASIDAYRTDLVSLFKNISFESLDQTKILQSSSGALQTIPVLLQDLQTAVQQQVVPTQETVRTKLKAWSGFYHRFYAALAALPIAPTLAPSHRIFLAWARYNETAINSLLSAPLTNQSVSAALDEYARAYAAYQPSYRVVFSRQATSAAPDGSRWRNFLTWIFSPMLRVAAQTGALLPFGGRIVSIADICTTGELIVIGGTPPPSSGAFFLYWTVYAANPYLYNAVIPSNSMLGDQFPNPGVCNKGTVTYPEGEGTITFFGTSLIPYSP